MLSRPFTYLEHIKTDIYAFHLQVIIFIIILCRPVAGIICATATRRSKT